MERRKINVSFESVLVLLLLIIFTVSIALIILAGSKSYNAIITQKEKEENARIALSFIKMRIKQNDVQGKITIKDNAVEGNAAIVIRHTDLEEGYITYIFSYNDSLWECYTDVNTTPAINLSNKITGLQGLEFSLKDNLLKININYEYGDNTLFITDTIALRSFNAEVVK